MAKRKELATELNNQFAEYWSRKVLAGKCSPLDRLEWMAIEIFTEWLVNRYSISKQDAPSRRAKP